ncbi:cupin domain-containing protein [Lysinibacillus xylanilyticus]|uniref:hypothetical protein n=1 Tax=Lysinibacillus xylanilyticus TaxID=582475 RepID=UPI00381E6D60
MKVIQLSDLINSDKKFEKLWESLCHNHRVLYFQIDENDEGIAAHFHPYGEDSAIILQGELIYDISFEQQLKAYENEIVFGWTNYVHGYHNQNSIPLHIIIFATPEQNRSVYDKDSLPADEYSAIRSAKLSPSMQEISSIRTVFSTGIMESYKNNTLSYNWKTKELRELNCNDSYPLIDPDTLFIQFK